MRPLPALPPAPLFLLALLAPAVPAEEVDGRRALETVQVLASDELAGRKSGLDSGRRAEAWMAERIEALGLKKWNGFTFFQEFKGSVTEEGGAPPRFGLAGGPGADLEGVYLDDYVTLIYSGKGVVAAPAVFAGYGIVNDRRNDYEGIDPEGKVVVAVRGAPPGFGEERYIGYKSALAADLGAVGFLLVEGDTAVPGTIQEQYHRENLPAAWISRKAADDLLARAERPNLETLKAKLEAGERQSFPLDGVTVRLEIHARLLKDKPMRNVVGVWPGDGSTDEVVVLGAHLDHVGVDAAGNVYNGADDNASGSAMLLEVARAIAATGRQFPRTILFVWFAAEEQGLTGSWAFVKNPPVPLEKIAVMINTDMVGQGKPVLAVGGAEVYPRDAGWLGGPGADGFETKPFRSQPNSDHYPFQTSGVPAFFVHTEGPHPNYHQPGDDVANIKPELLEAAGRFVRVLAERAATEDAPFVRERRHAEYLWHAGPGIDLWSGVHDPDPSLGVDLAVRWFGPDAAGAFNGIERAVAAHEGKGDTAAPVLLPGSAPQPLLDAAKPAILLGVTGRLAAAAPRPARRLGVLVFAPFLGADPVRDDPPGSAVRELDDLLALAKERPLILDLRGAPASLVPALASFPGPLVLGPVEAERWQGGLKAREAPWVVAIRCMPVIENKPGTWPEIARMLLDYRERWGAAHIHAGPELSETFAAQAETLAPGVIQALLDAGLKPPEIHQVFGGNLIRMLEAAAKP